MLGIQLSSDLLMVIFSACHAGMTAFPGSVSLSLSRTEDISGYQGSYILPSGGQLAGNGVPQNPPREIRPSNIVPRGLDYLRHFQPEIGQPPNTTYHNHDRPRNTVMLHEHTFLIRPRRGSAVVRLGLAIPQTSAA